jgi:L-histidine Nalpha-methyltransferase / hercynylcysteine S-oxide synthase
MYSLWLLERPAVFFPVIDTLKSTIVDTAGATAQSKPLSLLEASESPFAVPKMVEWEAMWKAWDAVTLGMIPPEMLHERPIDLRHICLFYLGHIPAYA